MVVQSWIIVGFIVGWLIGMVPGKTYDITLGLIGGLVGGSLVVMLFMVAGVANQDNVIWGIIAYIIAAILLMIKRVIFAARLKVGA